MKTILISLIAVQAAFASIGKEATITGRVSSFNEKSVKIYVNGNFVTVARSALVMGNKLAVGQEVTALVPTNIKIK